MKTPEQLQQDQETPDYIPFETTPDQIKEMVSIIFGRISHRFEPEPRSYKECGHGTPCFYARVNGENLINKPYAIMGFYSYLPDPNSIKAIRMNYFYDL